MRSEATVYCSDALSVKPALRRQDHCAVDGPTGPIDCARSSIEVTEQLAGELTPISEISDELLLSQIRDGEKEALALLFRRHARAVRNVAYRILRDEAEADDLVQEVFLFIFRKAALFNSALGTARTWIFNVAYHRAFDRRRYLNSRHFYASQELTETSLHLSDPRKAVLFHEQSMEGILGKQSMAKLNARLTAEQREAIELYLFDGYSFQEIAELTGRTLSNVRQHYYRGLEQIRKYVLPDKLRSK
jgi:RNA polymerase sigma-70 factor (ECF subfamily)